MQRGEQRAGQARRAAERHGPRPRHEHCAEARNPARTHRGSSRAWRRAAAAGAADPGPGHWRQRRAGRPGGWRAGWCTGGICCMSPRCFRPAAASRPGSPGPTARPPTAAATATPAPPAPNLGGLRTPYVREDQILPHLAAIAILLADNSQAKNAGTAQVTVPAETAALIDQMRASQVILTYDPDDRTCAPAATALPLPRPRTTDATPATASGEGDQTASEAPGAAGGRARGVTSPHARKRRIMGF